MSKCTSEPIETAHFVLADEMSEAGNRCCCPHFTTLGSGGPAMPGQGPQLPAPGSRRRPLAPGWGSGSRRRPLAPEQGFWQGLPLLVATIPCSPSQEARSQIRDSPQGHRGLEFPMASPRAVFSNIQYFHELDAEFNGTVCQFLMKIIGKATPLKHFSLG